MKLVITIEKGKEGPMVTAKNDGSTTGYSPAKTEEILHENIRDAVGLWIAECMIFLKPQPGVRSKTEHYDEEGMVCAVVYDRGDGDVVTLGSIPHNAIGEARADNATLPKPPTQ